MKKMFALCAGLMALGCDRYNDDKKGSFGNGPTLAACADPVPCQKVVSNVAQDIRTSDPDFETKYLDGMKLEDALSQMTRLGYLRRRRVRILKAAPFGDVMRVYLSVQNNQGEPIADITSLPVTLKRGDQELTFKTKGVIAEPHLSISTVMDYSGSMGPSRPKLEDATIKLHQAVPQAAFSVVKFASVAKVVAPMTRWESNAAFASVIKSPFPFGSTALFDGIISGVKTHQSKDAEAEQGSETLNLGIVFTDGVENASEATYENAKESLRQGSVPQIILGMGDVDIKSLLTMAEDTNGLFQFVEGGDGIEAAMARVGKIVSSIILVEIPLGSEGAANLVPEELVASFKEI